jgi:hypothetical protein
MIAYPVGGTCKNASVSDYGYIFLLFGKMNYQYMVQLAISTFKRTLGCFVASLLAMTDLAMTD